MLTDLARNDNCVRTIVTSVALVATCFAIAKIWRNPFPRLPKTNANLLDLLVYDRAKRDEESEKLLPPLERSVALGDNLLVINDPSLAHEVLVNGQNRYKEGHKIGRSPWLAEFHTLLIGGESIGNARGEAWRWRRDTLVPQFQPRAIISQILPSVIQRTETLVYQIKSHGGQPVDVDKYFVELTGQVICEYLFGTIPQPGELTFDNFRRTDVIMASVLLKPVFKFFGWKGPGGPEIRRNHKFVRHMLDEVKCGRGKRPDGSASLAEQLMNMDIYKGDEGEQRLQNDLLLLIFAGHDTTAHSLSFLVYSLTQELDAQEAIRKEVLKLMPEDSEMTAAKLAKLKYTSAAIKENLRIHPPVTVSMHQAYEDTVIGGTVVPKGCTIVISTARINRLPNVFTKPNAFLPERWLDNEEDLFRDLESTGEDKNLMNQTFLTFSRGTHSCLGMNLAYLELRVVISYLVKHFEFTYDGPVPETSGMIVALKNKLLIKFHTRE